MTSREGPGEGAGDQLSVEFKGIDLHVAEPVVGSEVLCDAIFSELSTVSCGEAEARQQSGRPRRIEAAMARRGALIPGQVESLRALSLCRSLGVFWAQRLALNQRFEYALEREEARHSALR